MHAFPMPTALLLCCCCYMQTVVYAVEFLLLMMMVVHMGNADSPATVQGQTARDLTVLCVLAILDLAHGLGQVVLMVAKMAACTACTIWCAAKLLQLEVSAAVLRTHTVNALSVATYKSSHCSLDTGGWPSWNPTHGRGTQGAATTNTSCWASPIDGSHNNNTIFAALHAMQASDAVTYLDDRDSSTQAPWQTPW